MNEKIEIGSGDDDFSQSPWNSEYTNVSRSDYQRILDDLQVRTCALDMAVTAAAPMVNQSEGHPEISHGQRISYLAVIFEDYLRTGNTT